MALNLFNRVTIFVLVFILTIALSMVGKEAAGVQSRVENSSTIIDQSGRRLVLKKSFKRIISLYGAHTENLFNLGLNKEIIGVSRHETYPPEASHKPAFSYHDDPERFIAARPDLVIIRPMIDRGYPQFVSALEKSGITIVSLQPDNVENMHTYWHILGILSGTRQRATTMISKFNTAVSNYRALTKSKSTKKRVYFEAIHSKMKTFAPHSMAAFALETAGGINIASDAKPVRNTNIAYYGKERILSHASEIDVYLAQSGAMNQPSVELIKNEPGFNVIKAVAVNQIFIIDEQIVSRPTLRLLKGIYEIGRILYPNLYDVNAYAILQRATEF